MRIVKILLVLAFLAVSVVYAIQDMSNRFSDADEPPVLSCDTEILEISVADDDSAMLSGVTATDAQDGDLSDQVLVSGVSKLVSDNTAKITYVVFDSDDNMATLTRQIRYTDYRLPRFSLEEPLAYTVNEQIALLDRLHAYDVVDGDVTDHIRVSYTEATEDPNVYLMDVQVTNSMGDTAWLTLPVIHMSSDRSWVDVNLDSYLMYLEQGDQFSARDHLESAAFGGVPVSLANVTISGDVDTRTPGTYMVYYTCTYGSNTGTAILTVVVE